MEQTELSFFARFGTAFACFFRALANPKFARDVQPLLSGVQPVAPVAPAPKPAPKPVELPPERLHASGLLVLSMLQREGRLIDFLQEDVASFPDADVGAAARVVHAGCRKVIQQALDLEPILKESEGASVTVPAGFDAQRIRVTGNVAGQPPFKGTLKHHGWVAKAVRLPTVSESLDPRVIAPAEVEL
jgi:hypothetical protein